MDGVEKLTEPYREWLVEMVSGPKKGRFIIIIIIWCHAL